MKAIKNIHEITKAMEMIAAFRFKRAENRYSKSRPFLVELQKLVSNLAANAVELNHPLFEKRQTKKKALVLLSADKGLCGAYNANVIRSAAAWLKENAAFETMLIPVGKVGLEYFKKRPFRLFASYSDKAATAAGLETARAVSAQLAEAFLKGEVDSVEILYMAYKLGTPGTLRVEKFLSLESLLAGRDPKAPAVDYIYEPDLEGVFSEVLSRYLEGRMYLWILESLASEYSARMIAMKQATENGEEVLDNLTLLRNKTRQATITRELSEIVSGASVVA